MSGVFTITPIVTVELQQKANEFLPNTNTSLMYPGVNGARPKWDPIISWS
jgi:hypothetical protein